MNVATSRRVAEIQNVEKVLNRSVDGRLLAIWQTDYSVAIYDTLHGLTVQRLAGHANEIVGACFLPCEQLVATISKAGEVVLWALDTGEQLVQFQANCRIKPVRKACLAFATDGRTLVAAGQITNDPMRWITELRTWQIP